MVLHFPALLFGAPKSSPAFSSPAFSAPPFYLHLPYLTPPLWGNPSEFRDETCSQKTRGMGLLYGENFIILTSTVFV